MTTVVQPHPPSPNSPNGGVTHMGQEYPAFNREVAGIPICRPHQFCYNHSMFFRNLLRVFMLLVLLIACAATIYLGPFLNIGGLVSVGWALLISFVAVLLLATTLVTYGGKI